MKATTKTTVQIRRLLFENPTIEVVSYKDWDDMTPDNFRRFLFEKKDQDKPLRVEIDGTTLRVWDPVISIPAPTDRPSDHDQFYADQESDWLSYTQRKPR